MSDTKFTPEFPIIFKCHNEQLIGMIHTADSKASVGVLVIVGGPQYRVGSHRQFILLARYLAAESIPSMRFDARGMGDSEGSPRNFADIDDDIRAALDNFFVFCPNLKQVVLWGLCDAASAALFYAYQDDRVKGLVLLNPWVFTEQGAAKTYLKHYYLQRLLNRDLWRKIFSFKFDYAKSVISLLNMLKQASLSVEANENPKIDHNLALPIRMRESLKQFSHPVLLILSGRDLTANEFKDTVQNDPEWGLLLKEQRLTRLDFAEADHTFSKEIWRNQIACWTRDWIMNSSIKVE